MFQRRLDTNRLPQSCKLRPQFFHCKSNWKGWVTTVQATMLRTPLLDIILFWIYFFEGTTIYVACSFFVPISHAAGRIRRDTSWGTIDGPCRKTETWQPAIFSNIFVEWKRKLVWTRRGGFLNRAFVHWRFHWYKGPMGVESHDLFKTNGAAIYSNIFRTGPDTNM